MGLLSYQAMTLLVHKDVKLSGYYAVKQFEKRDGTIYSPTEKSMGSENPWTPTDSTHAMESVTRRTPDSIGPLRNSEMRSLNACRPRRTSQLGRYTKRSLVGGGISSTTNLVIGKHPKQQM